MPLTDKAVLAAKPKEKNYRLYDRDGLYLEVSTSPIQEPRSILCHQAVVFSCRFQSYP